MLAFDLLDELTKLELHYTVGDTAQAVFSFRVKSGSTKVMNFSHDYQSVNAPVADFFEDPVKGDSLAFLQSLEGLNVKVEMPYSKTELLQQVPAELAGKSCVCQQCIDKSNLALAIDQA